ncbi:MAG: helix-turn-helix domain-containing protein [Candidatus Woesearchaeota archaeon]
MYEPILEDLGFSKNEAKAYLALLELGSATAGQVAEKSKVHRTNIYDALERMLERGVVSYTMVSNVKYFQATPPQNLFRLLKEKEERLTTVLPELLLKLQMSENKSEAHIFQGTKAFMDILHNFLNYNDPILCYGVPKEAPVMLKTQIPHFHKKRLPLKIPMKHIYNHDASERISFLKSMKYTDAKCLPQKFDSNVSTNICGDEVVISVWTKVPLIIQIKNKTLAESYKNYFNILWEAAK